MGSADVFKVVSGEPHRILVVDDVPANVQTVGGVLRAKGYEILEAFDGRTGLETACRELPDLILLDINMPELDGLTVCARLKDRSDTRMIPIILLTARSDTADVVRGFEAGADDYLVKPYHFMELLARVRCMLRIREAQGQLIRLNADLDELNRNLEQKVAEQVQELERVNRLRRFFSPQIVDTIVSEKVDVLQDHRREITVVFLDLRNFTSFAEHAGPREVIETIREYHTTVGPIIFRHQGTLERFTGDGIMVFLGDPEPMEDHALQAVRMSVAIRDAVESLRASWAAKGYSLGLGIGIATGEASLGTIGFEGRVDYAAIGSVTNLAARLCSKAAGGQILVAESTAAPVGDQMALSPCGSIQLRGFSQPQAAYEVD